MVKTDPCDSRTIYLCYASRYCVTREHYTRFYNMNGPISALSTQLSSQLSIKTFGFSQNQPEPGAQLNSRKFYSVYELSHENEPFGRISASRTGSA